MKKKLLLFIFPFILIGCGDDLKKEIETLKQEKQTIMIENDNLKKEIDELRNGPNRLYATAKNYYDNKQYSKALQSFKILIEKHPSSNEAIESKDIIITCEKEIKKIEDESNAKKAKEAQIEKEKIAQATSNMSQTRDDIRKITWFYHKNIKDYFRTNIQVYFGKPDNERPYLRLKTTYHSDTWLFINSMIIVVDDVQYPLKNLKFERDNSSSIWEWSDLLIDDASMKIVQSIADSKKTVIRFEGKQYYKDYTVTDKEKKCIKDTLYAFNALKQ